MAFNVTNDEVKGFTEDFACVKKIMNNLLDEDSMESFSKSATYVNQWRYRSVNGKTYNLEFWFNSGSLKGEELLAQFHHVTMRCEIVGARVFGMTCDAGGNNNCLYKLLRRLENLPEGGWLPINNVRTINSWDKCRYIYVFHCSTHDFKAMRNALFSSWFKTGKKLFMGKDDIPIGKKLSNVVMRVRRRESHEWELH